MGETQKAYRTGGARGETARGSVAEKNGARVKISSRFMTGTSAMLGATGATTEPVVEQTGQIWELNGPEVRSAQRWNCATRKMTPRNKAKSRSRVRLPCIFLLRTSLGKEGCGVKQSVAI